MEKTIKITRNGTIHQIPLNPLSRRRYFGGGGSDDPEQVPKYTPDQMQLLSSLIGQINPGQSVTPYPGQRVADPSQLQTGGFDLARGLSPVVQGSQDIFSQVLGGYDPSGVQESLVMGREGLQDIMQPWDATGAQDAWTANMQPAFNLWKDEMVPFLEEGGVRRTGSGSAGGTGRDIAKSGQQFASEMGGRLASDVYAGEQSHLNRQSRGVDQSLNMALAPGNVVRQAGDITGQGTQQLAQMLNFGGMEQAMNQQGLSAEQQKWQEGQPYNNPWLQYLQPALGAQAFDTVIGQEGPSLASELAPYAGAAATYYGLAAMSDTRVKENIKPMDKALEKVAKLTGFSYNYKFDKPEDRNGGVMAQTLEEVLPDAVHEIDGIKMVRYDAVIALLINAVNELHEIVRSN